MHTVTLYACLHDAIHLNDFPVCMPRIYTLIYTQQFEDNYAISLQDDNNLGFVQNTNFLSVISTISLALTTFASQFGTYSVVGVCAMNQGRFSFQ